ncbi:MAG: hypothetical protein ABEH35_05595 [Haloarculaceae archaeon]
MDRPAAPGTARCVSADSRAVSPVVEKLLVMGIVVLFVGLLTTTLFGGVVPDYRAAVGSELGDRTLALAAERIQQAVPPDATAVRSRTRVELPATIRGTGYALVVDGRSLVLDHPDAAVGGRIRLALPDHVAVVTGRWQSGAETTVVVRDHPRGLEVELTNGGRP